MAKVIYSIFAGKNYDGRRKGVGYTTKNGDLITYYKDPRTGKTKRRVYQDCVRYCHKTGPDSKEYRGMFGEWRDVELTDPKDGKKTTRELEISYSLWYKIIKDDD